MFPPKAAGMAQVRFGHGFFPRKCGGACHKAGPAAESAREGREDAAMRGLMQDWPLLAHKLLDHAASQHGGREIVSRSVEGPIHRTDYAALRGRALQCAKRLDRAGIRLGDRVATLAWNTWRHLEVWYGAM